MSRKAREVGIALENIQELLTWMIPVRTRTKKKTDQQKDELEYVGTYNQFKVVRLENTLSEDIEKLLDDSILKKKTENAYR